MIQKVPDDENHYSKDEISEELIEWNKTREKLFVTGTSAVEKRTPLKWKLEYSTSPHQKGEMIALSP